ncbi:hypothetical protein ST47_g9425 [Ascochyta rabiei]|uniref:Uncharacterized protein n=1 Tax=Didymella rabiei TaxID=5454 RepID=A0A162XEW0_DIDRA|nr:hypothetical protein ST47_g9425 [Ascochyta rabiei]
MRFPPLPQHLNSAEFAFLHPVRMKMYFLRYFFAATALSSLAGAYATDDASFGMKRGEAGFGSEPVFQGTEPGAFLEALLQEKNETAPSVLQDRTVELYGKRQNCQSGYGYCACTSFLHPFTISSWAETKG